MSANLRRRVVLRRRLPQEVVGGIGDYAEPDFYAIAPGAQRPIPPSTQEASSPSPLSVAQGTGSGQHPFQWVRETPFDGWDAFAYALGAVLPIRIDLPLRRPRRAVLVTNSDPAAFVWIGPSESVRVNSGLFIPPQGSVSIPLNENCQVYAISNVGGTVASICQFT